MHTTNLQKVGDSVMLVIPPAILDVLHLQAGTAVRLAVEYDRLVVEPMPQRYSLGELLAQCDPLAESNEEDRAWLDSKPVGKELL